MKVMSIVIDILERISKELVKETGRLGNQRTSGDHPDYSMIKIGKNTEKNPGDLRRLTVTRVKNHQLTLV